MASTREQQLKEEFIAARGYWSERWDELLQVDGGGCGCAHEIMVAPDLIVHN